MTTITSKKLKLLLTLFDTNKVLFSQELLNQGFSIDLIQWYKKAGWIVNFARGVYKKNNIDITLEDLIFAFQKQLDINVHFGGKYCLEQYYGINHFVTYSNKRPTLFLTNSKHKVPNWVEKKFNTQIKIIHSNFITSNIGLTEDNGGLIISTKERAFMELLSLVPQETSVVEAKEILELLPNLRPKLLQELLENCKSIKVKRLFLYIAEKVNHNWFKYLNAEQIDLGLGIREIEKHGQHIRKYQIVVKEEQI